MWNEHHHVDSTYLNNRDGWAESSLQLIDHANEDDEVYVYSCNAHFVHVFAIEPVLDQMLIEGSCEPLQSLERVEIPHQVARVQQLNWEKREYVHN